MADEIVNSTLAPAASSAEAAPTAAPVSTENPIPPAETPVEKATPSEEKPSDPVDPAKPEESPKTDAPVEEKKAETLLGGEKKAEEKPKEEAKTEEKTLETPKESPETPIYEPFTIPENIKFDEGKMNEFTKSLSDFEVISKASHDEVQKLGQQLIDKHLAEVQDTMQRYTDVLIENWNKQKNDWKDSFLKDPEFLNRTDTVVNSALDAINVYGGDEKQQKEFRELMESTGVGNHPAMIRLLSNIMIAKAEPKPLAAPTIAPKASNSKIQKMYGKKS